MLTDRQIGSSGITVPAIGLGTAGFGELTKGELNFVQSVAIVRLAVELGISFIDTAEAYESGNSERAVGEAIRGARDKVFLATKFSPQHSAPEGLDRAIEDSLRRLQTDHIDLYQMHWPNPSVPISETLSALERQVRKGRIGLIGLCNSSVKELEVVRSGLSTSALLAAVQNEYNVQERSCEEAMLSFCRENQITFVAHSPLSHGGIPPSDGRIIRIEGIAKKYGVTPHQLLLSWVIKDKQTIAIPRTLNEQHLRQNVKVLDIEIDQREYDLISDVFKPKIWEIPTSLIETGTDQRVYGTLEEAKRNRYRFVPGPLELAEEIRSGEKLKLIKVRTKETPEGPRYVLAEGKMRYWAWVIAYGNDVPIPAIVLD